MSSASISTNSNINQKKDSKMDKKEMIAKFKCAANEQKALRNKEELVNEMRLRKINFRESAEDLWMYPESLKKKTGFSLYIPGTRCPMLKNFIGIKIQHSKIYLIETSNRISFSRKLKPALFKFINYLNLINPMNQFCLLEAAARTDKQINISANRVFNINLKENCKSDFIEEILTIDKIYQNSLIEHLPNFLFKELFFLPVFGKHESMHEICKKSVIKSIKAMGFNQEKIEYPRVYHGSHCNISLAVNLDVGRDYDPNFDWRVMPIVVDIYDQLIMIKIKLCKNKHIVKIETETMQALMIEFINLANLNMKKAQFKFSYTQLTICLEGSIITSGFNKTEIQYMFQQLFSYMIENFKKYGGTLAKIYNSAYEQNKGPNIKEAKKSDQETTKRNSNESQVKVEDKIIKRNPNENQVKLEDKNIKRNPNENQVKPEDKNIKRNPNESQAKTEDKSKESSQAEKKQFNQEDVRNLYKDLKKKQNLEETTVLSLFVLNSSYIHQVEMLVPEEFETRAYAPDKFLRETTVVNKLIDEISECFHIAVDQNTNTIKYPIFESGEAFSKLIVLKGKEVKIVEEFLFKLHNKKFAIENPLDNIGVTRVGKNFFAYFIKFPISDYLRIDESVNSLSLRKHLLDIKKFIELSSQSNIDDESEHTISFIRSNDFDSPFKINTGEARLAGLRVYFEKQSKEYLNVLARKEFINLPQTINYIGFYSENNEYYVVWEKLDSLDVAKLSEGIVRQYIIEVIHTVLLCNDKSPEVFVVTLDDLFLNESKRLKIKIRPHPNHPWHCLSKSKNESQKQVYSLSMLIYNLSCKIEPFSKLSSIPAEKLRFELENDLRTPIFEWEFEKNNPKLVNFLRKCWAGEIETLEQMRDLYPIPDSV